MQHKIEFKDLNKAGQAAILLAEERIIYCFKLWGFECEEDAFFFDMPDSAGGALTQALVDYLVNTNQPVKAVPNERP